MKRTENMMKTLPGLVLLGFLAGCAAESDPPGQEEPHTLPRIPAISYGEAICDGEAAVPTVCDWAAATDTILVGTIERVEAVFSPVYVFWDDTPKQSCDQAIEPAMKIVLNVEKSLRGDRMGTQDIYIGRDHRLLFEPFPSIVNGQFAWNGSRAIVPGQKVGFGLVEFGGILTPNFREFFEIFEDAVHFQASLGSQCMELSPLEANGLSLAAFEARLESCDGGDADMVNSLKRRDEPARVSRQAHGLCWDDSPHPQPECVVNTDCPIAPVGMICVNEECVPE